MSKIIDPESIASTIQGILSTKKQFSGKFIDLTIAKLYRIKSGARLDFGGSEYQPGNLEPCAPSKVNPEDKYGWWQLHEGYFLMEFNEKIKLPENQMAAIQPHPHFLSGGCFHPTINTLEINEELKIPFWVPKIGIQIKENARISRMVIVDLS